MGDRAVAGGLPAVHEDDARPRGRAGGHVPAGQAQPVARRDLDLLVGQADDVGRPDGRVPVRVAGPDAVHEREAVGQGDREGRERGDDPGATCAIRRRRAGMGPSEPARRAVSNARGPARTADAMSGRYTRHGAREGTPCRPGRRSPAPAPTTSRRRGAGSRAGTTRTSPATIRRPRAARRAGWPRSTRAYAALTRAGETIEARRRAGADDARATGALGSGRRTRQQPGAGNGRIAAAARRPRSPPARSRPASTSAARSRRATRRRRRRARATRSTASRRCGRTARQPELRASQPSGPLERDVRAGHIRTGAAGPRRRPRHGARLRQVPRPHPGRGRRVRAVVRGLAGRHGDAGPRAHDGGAGDRRRARPAGDPAGASAAARPGWQSNPFRGQATTTARDMKAPPAETPEAPDEARYKFDRPATRACWPCR